MNDNLKYEELKEKFNRIGYVFSKNSFKRGYTATRNIGDGWTDANAPMVKFQGLPSAKKWLDKKIEWLNMTEQQREEQVYKEFKEWEREMEAKNR